MIVPGEPTETGAPGKGALDHPAPWKKSKALLGFFEFDHDQANSSLGGLVCGIIPGVPLIGKSYLDLLVGRFLDVFDQHSQPYLGGVGQSDPTSQSGSMRRICTVRVACSGQ